ncbi:MAG: hypothetical protein AAF617_00500 [Bacteroidota bacterium]
MRIQSFFIIVIWGLISFSCCGSKQVTSTDTNTDTNTNIDTPIQEPDIQIAEPNTDQIDNWSNQPDANSSMIKVSNAAVMFSSLPNGLRRMGFDVVENTGNSITTNTRNNIRITAWVDGSDVIFTSEVQQFTDNGYGVQEPSELVTCVRGDSSSLSECWRTIQLIANRIGGTKQYQ